jgi:GTP pyrophosphokinase
VEDMYAAAGAGELSSAQVLNATQELLGLNQTAPEIPLARPSRSGSEAGVQVRGVGNLLTHLAGCCKPLPGDGVAGFITQGRGVSVHRHDCSRLLQLQISSPERIVEVDWGPGQNNPYSVDVGIEAYDRPGLLRDVTEVMAQARIDVLAVNTQSNRKRHTATMRLRMEVPDLQALGRVLDRLSRLNNVVSAVRLSDDGVERAG